MSKLYDRDFFEWTREQGALLRQCGDKRINEPFDWENLAEEIESLGRSDWHGLLSAVDVIIEHLLKLEHSPAAQPRSGWKLSIDAHRSTAARQLASSPSLRGRLASVCRDEFRTGRRRAAPGLADDGVDEGVLPRQCPHTLEQILDEDWLPVSRHGLS